MEALAENVDTKRAAAESRVHLCEGKLEAGRQAVLDTWAEAARCRARCLRTIVCCDGAILQWASGCTAALHVSTNRLPRMHPSHVLSSLHFKPPVESTCCDRHPAAMRPFHHCEMRPQVVTSSGVGRVLRQPPHAIVSLSPTASPDCTHGLPCRRLGSAVILESFRGFTSAEDWLSATETAYNDAREREAAERAADVDADGVVKSEALLGRQVCVTLPLTLTLTLP